MNRAQFLTELALRHRSRMSVLFTPGPDESENPEAAVVISAPTGDDTRWRVHRRERNSQTQAWLPDESSAYEYALAAYFPRLINKSEPPMSEADFLAEIDRRELPRNWFVLPGDTGRAADGAVVIEEGPPRRVYPSDAPGFATTVGTAGEAFRSAIDFVVDPAVRAAMTGADR